MKVKDIITILSLLNPETEVQFRVDVKDDLPQYFDEMGILMADNGDVLIKPCGGNTVKEL